ncbi:hypothetical protein [Proteiniphilum sp. UBA5384]|uniref:hypothetical protein n=1 Tax=Proteiniphilum sp. UBA5384 TaxID=1947279 RepID=UPI0025E6FA99|nr:hypothetical protein [Proteiniphilum sp. UBA5384]
MKINYRKLPGILLLALPGFMFLSCNDKEDLTPIKDTNDLVIGQKQVELVVGDKTELEIAEGNNEYKALVLNEEVASVKISGNKLLIDALSLGRTPVIISDGSSQYCSIDIVSYHYKTVSVESDATIDILLPLGDNKTKSIKILEGNGGYHARSSAPEIVSASVEGEQLLITGKKEGKASIVLSDGLDFAITTIEVNVTTTSTTPYDTSELDAIKKDETLCYVFNNTVDKNENTYYTLLNGTENEKNLYGWDLSNYWYLKIYFAGDKTVGKKQNASLVYNRLSENVSADNIYFEIIKNDGEKIWAVYSLLKNEKLYYGYFIQAINP